MSNSSFLGYWPLKYGSEEFRSAKRYYSNLAAGEVPYAEISLDSEPPINYNDIPVFDRGHMDGTGVIISGEDEE